MVSVLIPTVQTEHLRHLLPYLRAEVEQIGGEILIANNTSLKDNNQYKNNFISVINNSDKKTYAESNNQLSKLAKHDYFLLLNDDTHVPNGTIQTMLKTFSIDPAIGIVGCRIHTWDNTKIQHAGIHFVNGYPQEIRYENINEPKAMGIHNIQAVTGCCLLVKRAVWEKLQGFNEQFRNGWEDNDFNIRAHNHGFKVWYNGQAVIRHRHFGSKDFGRMDKEEQNVNLYKRLWIDTGKIKRIVW